MATAEITIHHTPELACWTVNARQLSWSDPDRTEEALEDQKEVWKKHKPSKADPQVRGGASRRR